MQTKELIREYIRLQIDKLFEITSADKIQKTRDLTQKIADVNDDKKKLADEKDFVKNKLRNLSTQKNNPAGLNSELKALNLKDSNLQDDYYKNRQKDLDKKSLELDKELTDSQTELKTLNTEKPEEETAVAAPTAPSVPTAPTI